jgi:hypothetical protein
MDEKAAELLPLLRAATNEHPFSVALVTEDEPLGGKVDEKLVGQPVAAHVDVLYSRLPRLELGGGTARHHPPLFEDADAVADLLDVVEVVGRKEERRPFVLRQPSNVLAELNDRGWVEAGERLVQKDDRGPVKERARDRELLSHPLRERTDPLRSTVPKIAGAEELLDSRAGFGPEISQRGMELEIVERGQALVVAVVVEEDADLSANLGRLDAWVAPVDPHFSPVGREKAEEDPKRRRLPRAVAAEEAEYRPALDDKVETAQARPRAEGLRDVPELDRAGGHSALELVALARVRRRGRARPAKASKRANEQTRRTRPEKPMNSYEASIHQFKKMLTHLDKWLEASVGYAQRKSFDPDTLLSARLAPDQYALARQVQACCDTAKFAAARLTGKEPPKHADVEQTMAELRTRIRTCVTYLETFQPADFEKSETRPVDLAFLEGKYLLGSDYLIEMAIPNFYFHVSTAYAILRHNGVELGKRDFIGALSTKDR